MLNVLCTVWMWVNCACVIAVFPNYANSLVSLCARVCNTLKTRSSIIGCKRISTISFWQIPKTSRLSETFIILLELQLVCCNWKGFLYRSKRLYPNSGLNMSLGYFLFSYCCNQRKPVLQLSHFLSMFYMRRLFSQSPDTLLQLQSFSYWHCNYGSHRHAGDKWRPFATPHIISNARIRGYKWRHNDISRY